MCTQYTSSVGLRKHYICDIEILLVMFFVAVWWNVLSAMAGCGDDRIGGSDLVGILFI